MCVQEDQKHTGWMSQSPLKLPGGLLPYQGSVFCLGWIQLFFPLVDVRRPLRSSFSGEAESAGGWSWQTGSQKMCALLLQPAPGYVVPAGASPVCSWGDPTTTRRAQLHPPSTALASLCHSQFSHPCLCNSFHRIYHFTPLQVMSLWQTRGIYLTVFFHQTILCP